MNAALKDGGMQCSKHGKKYLIERRGIGCTEFLCDRCSWRSGDLLTELFICGRKDHRGLKCKRLSGHVGAHKT